MLPFGGGRRGRGLLLSFWMGLVLFLLLSEVKVWGRRRDGGSQQFGFGQWLVSLSLSVRSLGLVSVLLMSSGSQGVT